MKMKKMKINKLKIIKMMNKVKKKIISFKIY